MDIEAGADDAPRKAGSRARERRTSPYGALLLLLLAGCVCLVSPPVAEMMAAFAVVLFLSHVPGIVGRRRMRSELRRFRLVLAEFLKASGREPLASRPPGVLSLRTGSEGWVADLLLPAGASIEDCEALRPRLAASYRVRDVTFTRRLENAGVVTMTLVDRDPLAGPSTVSPLATEQGPFDFCAPLPLGLDEQGKVVSCPFLEHNLLLGGEPGAGKSNALSLVVAAAALDPSVRLSLLDGKYVELGAWSEVADSFCGNDVEAANRLLEEVRDEMDMRYLELRRLHRRKVTASDGLALRVVICDELAFFLNHPEKKAAQRFAELLRDIVARGRAAGVIVIAATQKPGVDTVPSALRDLFGYRWAMRCSTREASDTILGSGWSTKGYSAAEIDAGVRGVGLLRHEGAAPVKLRAFHLGDEHVEEIARRAAQLRREFREQSA